MRPIPNEMVLAISVGNPFPVRVQRRVLLQIDLQASLDGAVAAADVEPDPDHAHLIRGTPPLHRSA